MVATCGLRESLMTKAMPPPFAPDPPAERGKERTEYPDRVSLNAANPPPCLPSVTNAPARQVPYSSFLNVNKPHNVTNLCKITVRLLHSMNIQMPMF